jgi:hypothetical protein
MTTHNYLTKDSLDLLAFTHGHCMEWIHHFCLQPRSIGSNSALFMTLGLGRVQKVLVKKCVAKCCVGHG